MRVRGLEPGRRPALLISEMQNGIANGAYTQSPLVEQVATRAIVPKINALAEGFRAAGHPVLHCTVTMRPGGVGWNRNCVIAARIETAGYLVHGTPSAAIHDDILVAAGDIVCERHHGMTAFTGTDLDATLRGLGVDTVVFAGVSTNVALMGGSCEAVGNGYHVVIAEDCTAGGTAETHRMQVKMHLPLVATICDAASVLAAIKDE